MAMVIGKVTGSVVSTRKAESLVGSKLMTVNLEGKGKIVAIDNLGAGIGETVLVTLGSAARYGCQNHDVPVDAVIVGIVDNG
jgi:ethanolamine utilization protein EutN